MDLGIQLPENYKENFEGPSSYKLHKPEIEVFFQTSVTLSVLE
jgi:hypothetical protein